MLKIFYIRFEVLFFLIYFFSCSFYVNAQEKVIDRSTKKRPSWVNSIEKNHIIGFAKAVELSDAQQKAMSQIKEQVVNSIAVNVKTSSSSNTLEINNNDVFTFLNEFSSNTNTSSANIPFLKGISISKAVDFFWEKIEDKSNKKTFFRYYIKYPFTDDEISKLVFEFNLLDKKFENKLEELIENVELISSLEDISNNIAELKLLADYFNDSRRSKVDFAIQRYLNVFKSIEFIEEKNINGVIEYYLKYSDKKILAAQQPVFISNCASLININSNASNYIIKYDHKTCFENNQNSILLKYEINGETIEKKFNLYREKIIIKVIEPIIFQIKSNEQGADYIQLSLSISAKSNSAFTVENVIININFNHSLYVFNLNQSYNGNGNHILKCNYDATNYLTLLSEKHNKFPTISGQLHIKNIDETEVKIYKFDNKRFSINW